MKIAYGPEGTNCASSHVSRTTLSQLSCQRDPRKAANILLVNEGSLAHRRNQKDTNVPYFELQLVVICHTATDS